MRVVHSKGCRGSSSPSRGMTHGTRSRKDSGSLSCTGCIWEYNCEMKACSSNRSVYRTDHNACRLGHKVRDTEKVWTLIDKLELPCNLKLETGNLDKNSHRMNEKRVSSVCNV